MRTYPDVAYFGRSDVQDMLVDILFIHAKLHPELGYKQGLHEILALVLLVCHHDTIASPAPPSPRSSSPVTTSPTTRLPCLAPS